MIYDFSNIVSKAKFDFRVERDKEAGNLVEYITKRPVRSNQQNRYLHGVVLPYFAIEYGETVEYIKEEYFKKIVNKELFKTTYTNTKNGEVREDWLSTKDLDTKQMSVAIDRFRDYASKEAGIYIPEANEEEFIKHCMEQISQHDRYL
jgi:hypothetical protein